MFLGATFLKDLEGARYFGGFSTIVSSIVVFCCEFPNRLAKLFEVSSIMLMKLVSRPVSASSIYNR